MNGITLTTGKDFFESRLHLRDQIASIQWQSHDDWDNGREILHTAAIETDVWNEFLNQINNAAFSDLQNPDASRESIYDAENQAHLILTMNDGTVVRLRLIKGGYVGYDALSWYFVQIPTEIFDTVFSVYKDNG